MDVRPKAHEVLISGWTLIGVAAALIIARVYLRVAIQRRRLLISDGLIIVAWIAGVAGTSITTVFAHLDALHPDVNTKLQHYPGNPKNIPLIFKLIWISNIPFWTCIYLCKAALLSMYLEIFPDFMRKRRIFLWATIAYNALAYVSSLLVIFCICTPLERNWVLNFVTMCPVSKGILTVKITWGLSIVGDLLVFALPWCIVTGLNMRWTLKLGVYCTFLLGIVNIIFDTMRFATIISSVHEDAVPMSLIALWSLLDGGVAIIIACLPSLRPYFSLRSETSTSRSTSGYVQRTSDAYSHTNSAFYREKDHRSEDQDSHSGPQTSNEDSESGMRNVQ